MTDYIVSHFYYWVVVVLMMIGLYAVFATGNMVKRLVGLGVFQTSVFLFYVSLGKVAGGVPPILPMKKKKPEGEAYPEAGSGSVESASPDGAGSAASGLSPAETAGEVTAGATAAHAGVQKGHAVVLESASQAEFAADAVSVAYSNPLPHVLILTAIVVGVATLAVGLSIVVRVREAYGTIEDDEINRMEYDTEIEGADA